MPSPLTRASRIALADRLIAAKVCHQQLIPLSNSLETRSDDAVELRKLVEEAAMVISKQTTAALHVIGDVITSSLDGSASKSDLQMHLLGQLVVPTTFKSLCKVAQTFQASRRVISQGLWHDDDGDPKGPRTQIIGLQGPNTIIFMVFGP